MASLRGQAAFEYLLIIGGAVLFATVAMMVVQGIAGDTNNAVTGQTHTFTEFINGFVATPAAVPTPFPVSTATPTPTPTPTPVP